MSMEKFFCTTLFVVRGAEGEDYRSFTGRLRRTAEELAQRESVSSCKLALTTGPPPKFSVIPYKKSPIALITLRGAESGHFCSEDCRDMSDGIQGLIGCYHGDCVLPVAYTKEWADKEETPGAGLLTLFKKRPDIDYETFIDRWHNGHTPLSLEIHPLWNYARNVVTETAIPDSEPYDGIVEEHFRTRKELTGWARFFGGFGRMVKNMISVYKDMNGFIDRKTIEPYFITEYWIKSNS